MTNNRIALVLALGTALGSGLASSPDVAARGYGPADFGPIPECQARIRKQVFEDHKGAREVRFVAQTSKRQQDPSDITIQGKGSFQRHNGDWRGFDYRCRYDLRRDRIESASYEIGGKDEWGWGEHDQDSAKLRRAIHRCKGEVEQKIYQRSPAASWLRWDKVDVDTAHHRDEWWIRGSGDFTGGRGNQRHFDYRCLYDRRFDEVVKTWLDD